MKSIAQTVAHSRSLRNMTMRRTMAGSTCRAIGVAIGVRQSGSGSCEKINSPQIPVRQTKDLARRKELQKQLIHSFQSPNSAIGAIGVGQSGSGSCKKTPQGVNLRCQRKVERSSFAQSRKIPFSAKARSLPRRSPGGRPERQASSDVPGPGRRPRNCPSIRCCPAAALPPYPSPCPSPCLPL